MISRHHIPSNVVSQGAYCKKCGKQTQHRVEASHKLGPCLDCMKKVEENFKLRPKPEESKQERLFA